MSVAGMTTLTVYDILGKEIAVPVNGWFSAGAHGVDFSAAQLNSGIYFYTLRSGKYRSTKKMMLIK